MREQERKRSKAPGRRKHLQANADEWNRRNPDGYRAHNVANNAIRDGKLNREPCQICGAAEHVHKHHRDYSRPLEVTWLCARCHHRLHTIFPELRAR